jgi:glycosyltransferase involved in cell wall biosynthesis
LKDPVIISHGRITVEKGYEQFLDVLVVLLKENLRFKFVLVGDGVLKENLIKKCGKLGLTIGNMDDKPIDPSSTVFLTGYEQNPFKYLKHAAVFVLPSFHEGFGNSIAEAMACGLPVLASDCPYGPREILAPSTSPRELYQAEWTDCGALLPQWKQVSAVEQWAKSIALLLQSPQLTSKYSQAAIERIENFDIRFTKRKWQELVT